MASARRRRDGPTAIEIIVMGLGLLAFALCFAPVTPKPTGQKSQDFWTVVDRAN